MLKMNRRSALKTSAASIGAAAALPQLAAAQAGFTPPQHSPDDLKGTQLTPFGSVRAGNADGSIPAWTGENLPLPANYQQGDPRPIPFQDEKPLYTITAQNLDQYKDKLSNGQLGMFAKYPDFTMQVFPTHRTAIAPQWVYDYIYKNASNAKISSDGNSVTGAYGGIPFPFPQNGKEVVWNHLLAFNGSPCAYFQSDAFVVTATGQKVFESKVNVWFQYPYYFQNGENRWNGFYLETFILPIAPPYEAGGSIMQLEPVNPGVEPVEAWEYLQGQRRVRRAPELVYDTPNSLAGGVTNWDEADIFSGELNEYNFNYVGMKEVFIPYNSNKFCFATTDEQLQPHFVNPTLIRYELHRCKVVEMTLAPGSRNVDAKRILYCDDDAGFAAMGEVYDANGSLWKFMHGVPVIYPDVPCLQSQQNFITFDLHAGTYTCGDFYNASCSPQWKIVPEKPASFFTPGQLAASSGGF